MSKKPHPLQEHYHCRSKVQYDTRTEARVACEYVWLWKGEKLDAYKCAYCTGYHVGHKPKRHAGDRLSRKDERS